MQGIRAVSVQVAAFLCVLSLRSCPVSAQTVGGADLVLSRDGQTQYRIVVAGDASAPEQNAARELAAYLQKATTADFSITTAPDAGGQPVIAVGPGAAKAVDPDLDLTRTGPAGLGDDGIVIRTVGEHLVLSGAEGSKRGTLYAVYEFLSREVGVRWWTPEAETVPGRRVLSVRQLDIRYTPPFIYRETLCSAIRPFVWEETDAVPLFAVRMRQNGHFARIPPVWGGHYNLIGWCHTFYGLMPPDRYFKDHPDWYSEIGGQRRWEKAQLCLTNEEMIAELARNVLARIRRDPEAGMISVTQNDWTGHCRCDRCRALDEAEGSPAGSLLYAINRVAEVVEQEFPGFHIETLAYMHTRKPPRSIRPRSNVIVRLAVIERSATQPLEHPANASVLDDLEAWSAVAPNLYIWDYTANLLNPFTPEPRAFIYGQDLRIYRRSGAVSVFCEHSHGASPLSDFDQLHTWLLSQLMWDPERDDRALIHEFCQGYYGAAGPFIEDYLKLLADRVGDHRVRSFSGPRDAEWLDLETMNRATELMDAASAAVAGDAILEPRVQRARLSLDHQWLCGYAGYRHTAQAKQIPFEGPEDLARALDAFTERARAQGVERIGYGRTPTLTEYLAETRHAGEEVPPRLLLASDERYQRFLAGEPVMLPAPFAELAPETVVDIQEDRMSLYGGAELVPDPSASNSAAARLDPKVVSWAVQVRELPRKGVSGRWHAYAVIRVEALAQSGVAFTGGVYDTNAARNLRGISQRLEGQAGAVPDPNVPTDEVAALAESITDGQYRVYDLGTHDFVSGVDMWIGTTGGVDPKNVKAIYVDRFVFVRE